MSALMTEHLHMIAVTTDAPSRTILLQYSTASGIHSPEAVYDYLFSSAARALNSSRLLGGSTEFAVAALGTYGPGVWKASNSGLEVMPAPG